MTSSDRLGEMLQFRELGIRPEFERLRTASRAVTSLLQIGNGAMNWIGLGRVACRSLCTTLLVSLGVCLAISVNAEQRLVTRDQVLGATTTRLTSDCSGPPEAGCTSQRKLAVESSAANDIGENSNRPRWRPLLLGGGGWVVGLDISNDGQIIARTDTYGAYLYDKAANLWSQLVTIDRLPRELFGFYPPIGARQVGHQYGGVFDIAAAPNKSNIIYMFYGGSRDNSYLLKSVDRGRTFAKTNFPSISLNTNSRFRINGRNLAIDPYNSNVVYAGTQMDGVWLTKDGGETWRRLSSVPASLPVVNIGQFKKCVGVRGGLILKCDSVSTNAKGWGIADRSNPFAVAGTIKSVSGHDVSLSQPLSSDISVSDEIISDAVSNGNFPGYNIAFDQTSRGSGGASRVVIAGNFGGVYISEDGGRNWVQSPGSPRQVQHLVISPRNGVVWAVDGLSSGYVWKLEDHKWTRFDALGNGMHSVAVDPHRADHVIAAGGGGSILFSSFDGGKSWSSSRYARSADDVPWLAWTNEIYMSNGDMVFDPSDPKPNGGLWFGEGIGVWYTNPLVTGNGEWHSRTAGIEQLIGLQVIAPTGTPVVSVEDRSQFRLSVPSVYPRSGNEISAVFPLVGGYGINYASSDRSYLVGLGTGQGFGNFDYTSFSSDGGSTWRPLNTWYAEVAPSNISRYFGRLGWNLVQVAVPSTKGLRSWEQTPTGSVGDFLTILPSRGFGASGTYPIAVLDNNNVVLLNSSYTSTVTFGNEYYLLYRQAIPKSSYNGSLVISHIGRNGSGGIRVTVLQSFGSFFNGQYMCLAGVAGATEANGCWRVSVVKNGAEAQVDLLNSRFSNAWIGGGMISTIVPAGGSIAAATPNNLIRIPSNNDFPYCTHDGGRTWSVLNDWSTMPGPGFLIKSTDDANAGSKTIYLSSTNSGVQKVFVGDQAIDINRSSAIPANTVVTGVSPATVTLSAPINGDGLKKGDKILFRPKDSGWGWAYYFNRRIVDADRSAPNLFYLFNYNYGLYQVKNCDKPTRVNDGKMFGSLGSYHAVLRTVPHEAGHLFFAAGPMGNSGDLHPANTRLWRTCDGGRSWQIVPNIWEPISVGYGAPDPKHHYPAIYVIGWYSEGPTKDRAVYGIWRSIDDRNDQLGGVSEKPVACQTGNTWQKLGDYPLGWSGANDVSGDLTRFGLVYVALGNGFAYGDFK